MMLSGRDAFVGLAFLGLGGNPSRASLVSSPPLSFTLYGMRDVPLKEALPTLAKMGYGGVEVAAMPGWVTDPLKCSSDTRNEIRDQLKDHGLKLVSVMESIPFSPDAKVFDTNQDKLKSAIQLGHDLAPDQTPLLETILGGKPGELSKHQGSLIEMLHSWARILEQHGGRIALKAHRFQMVNTHEDLSRLLSQCPAKQLLAAFDPSHQPDPSQPCDSSFQAVSKRLGFIHIKDVLWNQSPQKDAKFALPGEGKLDWKSFAKILAQSDYRGPICVEVSRQVWEAKGYDPIIAARKSMEFWKGWGGER